MKTKQTLPPLPPSQPTTTNNPKTNTENPLPNPKPDVYWERDWKKTKGREQESQHQGHKTPNNSLPKQNYKKGRSNPDGLKVLWQFQ